MMTVAELIQKLSTMDSNLQVLMSMNSEYTSTVTADMVVEWTLADGTPVVYIDDCAGE
jgi:hypothetical protein